MQLDSNVVYVHGQNRFCFKFFKYLVVLILSEASSRVTKSMEWAKARTNVWYLIFGTKVYNHQNGIIMQIKAWKLDHEFIIGSSIKCM